MGFVTNQSPLSSYFIGYSTVGADVTGVRQLHDAELISQDLLNQFNTFYGERIMRPSYGCKIWQWLMEPMTDSLMAMLYQEANRILTSDSRVQIQSPLVITELDQGYRVDSLLLYTPLAVYQNFTVNFEQRQTDTSTGNAF